MYFNIEPFDPYRANAHKHVHNHNIARNTAGEKPWKNYSNNEYYNSNVVF